MLANPNIVKQWHRAQDITVVKARLNPIFHVLTQNTIESREVTET
jgi:hypothetical protein